MYTELEKQDAVDFVERHIADAVIELEEILKRRGGQIALTPDQMLKLQKICNELNTFKIG